MTQRPRHDIAELKRRVSLAGLIGQAVALKRRGKDFWGLCPFHTEGTPSFSVNESKGFYHCFGCGANGDAFDFLTRHHKLSPRDAVEKLAQLAGGAQAYARAEAPPRAAAKPEADRKADAARWAEKVWNEGYAADCTPVEKYLAGRGIDAAKLGGLPASLRYHRDLWESETRRAYPAMLGCVTDAGGKVCGLHRTYLSACGRENNPVAAAAVRAITGAEPRELVVKAPIPSAKKMAGAVKGGCVRLAPAGPVLAVAEGIETALSVMQATGLPAWAALSLNNLGELTLPPEVFEVRLFCDGDNKDEASAERLVQQAADRYRAQGVRVTIARPPRGMDFNDVLLEHYRGLLLAAHPPAS